ncbi:MAG: terminase large subunit [Lachnospiraceae bacterium]|nr:terminase large subunit [Lachnospiraceae bacterium]
MLPYKNYIYEYHAKISSGEIVAGKWIKAIYKIIVDGLEKQEYFFNAKAANKAIKFIENFCHHSKGRSDLLKLELWQKAIISVIFGIQDAEKIRIFREIFIVIGRKNGKSLFASALIAYMAFLEPEYGQEIYCLAPKLDQAALVYDGFHKMVKAEPELEELAKKRRSDIYIEESNTFIKPIAFNAKKSDGFNPQLVVCDEMAAWRGDAGLKQYEVMKSALGARTQPIILSISTAGYENDSIYDELMKRSTSFLKGNSKERRLLPFLYMIDDVEKWNDIEELKKANPNMGVSVKEGFFIDEIAVAENSLSKKAEFLCKYCNIKQNSSIAWLEYMTVDRAGVEKALEDFRDCYAVGGIDLSQTTDLTAASVVIEKGGVLYAFTQFFMPRNRIESLQATDGVSYDIFVKKGLITLSGENYVDYKDVYNWFIMLLEVYGIRPLKIGYDRYSAQYLVNDMKNYGFHMDDVWQGENLTPVIREFEGIIKDGNFKIADNNLLKAHFLNVALKHNMETRKFRPVKIEQRAHIDGFVSVIDAMTVRQKYWEECGELLKNAA